MKAVFRFVNTVPGRLALTLGTVIGWTFGVVGIAGATEDPTLTSATSQVTSYFTDNFPVVIGVFLAVTAVIWMFAKAVHWVGIRGRVR